MAMSSRFVCDSNDFFLKERFYYYLKTFLLFVSHVDVAGHNQDHDEMKYIKSH